MCSLGRKKGVIGSLGANTGTHFLAPSFAFGGSRFDVEVGLKEEEPDLEPRDFEVRDIVCWKWRKSREVLDFLSKERVRN
jgi:hypothetical protein